MKNKRSNEKAVTAAPAKLLEFYKSFFMDSNSALTLKQQTISEKVSDFFGSYTRPQNFPSFTIENLEDAFKEIRISPVKGYDSISYQML